VADGPRIESLRQELQVSPDDLLRLYLRLDGQATPQELGAFLVGEIGLEQAEVDKLQEAMRQAARPGSGPGRPQAR
jgi:hypothetical protein